MEEHPCSAHPAWRAPTRLLTDDRCGTGGAHTVLKKVKIQELENVSFYSQERFGRHLCVLVGHADAADADKTSEAATEAEDAAADNTAGATTNGLDTAPKVDTAPGKLAPT